MHLSIDLSVRKKRLKIVGAVLTIDASDLRIQENCADNDTPTFRAARVLMTSSQKPTNSSDVMIACALAGCTSGRSAVSDEIGGIETGRERFHLGPTSFPSTAATRIA